MDGEIIVGSNIYELSPHIRTFVRKDKVIRTDTHVLDGMIVLHKYKMWSIASTIVFHYYNKNIDPKLLQDVLLISQELCITFKDSHIDMIDNILMNCKDIDLRIFPYLNPYTRIVIVGRFVRLYRLKKITSFDYLNGHPVLHGILKSKISKYDDKQITVQ
jgi:hypothetical protein